MNLSRILEMLSHLGDQEAIQGMAKYGIPPERNFGVPIPELRKLAKEIGKDHLLAQELWEYGGRETKILACMVEDQETVFEEQINEWVLEFDSWEICDQCVQNLIEKLPFAKEKAIEWSQRDEEFVKRAGFVLMARLAVSNKKMKDEEFLKFFPYIVKGTNDEKNFVKKAVSWAIRQIGKRNMFLHDEAVKLAEEIEKIDSKAARWIAKDALKELRKPEIVERVKGKNKNSGSEV